MNSSLLLFFVSLSLWRAEGKPGWSFAPSLLETHKRGALSVHFSPDQELVASGGIDARVRVREWKSGLSRYNVEGPSLSILSVQFSPKGEFLAAGGNGGKKQEGQIYLYEAKTGKRLYALDVPVASVTSMAFQPDGANLVYGSTNGRVMVHNLSKPNSTHEIYRTSWGPVSALAIAGDGESVFVASERDGVQRVRIADGKALRVQGTIGSANSLAISPNGALLAAGYKSGATIIEVTTGRVFARLRGFSDVVSSLAFSSDGMALIAGTRDSELVHLDLLSGESHRTKGHRDWVWSVAMAPGNGGFATASMDETVLFWKGGGLVRTLLPSRLSYPEVCDLWVSLGSEEGGVALRAEQRLSAEGSAAVHFLRRVLSEMGRPQRDILRQIRDLDSDDFGTRRRAAEELEKAGRSALIPLKQANASGVSPEVKRSTAMLIRVLEARDDLNPDERRGLRAVQVLERIGTPVASQLLKELSSRADLTGEGAQEALKRLARRK